MENILERPGPRNLCWNWNILIIMMMMMIMVVVVLENMFM